MSVAHNRRGRHSTEPFNCPKLHEIGLHEIAENCRKLIQISPNCPKLPELCSKYNRKLPKSQSKIANIDDKSIFASTILICELLHRSERKISLVEVLWKNHIAPHCWTAWSCVLHTFAAFPPSPSLGPRSFATRFRKGLVSQILPKFC